MRTYVTSRTEHNDFHCEYMEIDLPCLATNNQHRSLPKPSPPDTDVLVMAFRLRVVSSALSWARRL